MSKQSGILYNLLLWAQISFRLLFGQQNSAQTKNFQVNELILDRSLALSVVCVKYSLIVIL